MEKAWVEDEQSQVASKATAPKASLMCAPTEKKKKKKIVTFAGAGYLFCFLLTDFISENHKFRCSVSDIRALSSCTAVVASVWQIFKYCK